MSANDQFPSEPLDDNFGFGRGTPIDRLYIEKFLADHSHLIHGAVLEVQDDTYTQKFGFTRVGSATILNVDPSNPNANLNADLNQPDSLPCIILTQTLHLLRNPGRSITNCYQSLHSGGALLVTAPTVGRVSPTYPDNDFWRFTPAGISELFARYWEGEIAVHSWGNLRSCIGFLMGQVVEDYSADELNQNDPRFVLTVGVVATKP